MGDELRKQRIASSWESIVPRDVMEEYSYGYCTRLAIALSKRFGWPIKVGYEGNKYDMYISHAWVELPDGRGLDICGFDGHKDFEPQFTAGVRTIGWQDLEELVGATPDEIAKADTVIDKYIIPGYLKNDKDVKLSSNLNWGKRDIDGFVSEWLRGVGKGKPGISVVRDDGKHGMWVFRDEKGSPVSPRLPCPKFCNRLLVVGDKCLWSPVRMLLQEFTKQKGYHPIVGPFISPEGEGIAYAHDWHNNPDNKTKKSSAGHTCELCDREDYNHSVTAAVFYIEVPKSARSHFWEEPPERNWEFWAYKDRPYVLPGEKIVFTFDRKPIAETVCHHVEEPGKSKCDNTGEYENHWKIYWEPSKFKRYKTAANSGSEVPKWRGDGALTASSAMIPLYRGESQYNRNGRFWTTDPQFALQFTQSGRENEVRKASIYKYEVYRRNPLPYGGDFDDIDAAIIEAKAIEDEDYKAVWCSEGVGEPDSIYVFDRSALVKTASNDIGDNPFPDGPVDFFEPVANPHSVQASGDFISKEAGVKDILKGLGAALLAVAAGTAITYKAPASTPKPNPDDAALNRVGHEMIKHLPDSIKRRIGDPNTIIFKEGVPATSSNRDAVCQVEKGTRVIYVNPEYVDAFLHTDLSDQETAHEVTHIMQSEIDPHGTRFPKTNESNPYGRVGDPDAWKSFKDLRSKGDRMWNHSREEQAAIVQQYEALVDMQKKTTDPEQKHEIKQKLKVFTPYIADYNQLKVGKQAGSIVEIDLQPINWNQPAESVRVELEQLIEDGHVWCKTPFPVEDEYQHPDGRNFSTEFHAKPIWEKKETEMIEPSGLRTFQPQVSAEGVLYYLNNPEELNTPKKPFWWDEYPVIVDGLIHEGNHRAVAAFVLKKKLKVTAVYLSKIGHAVQRVTPVIMKQLEKELKELRAEEGEGQCATMSEILNRKYGWDIASGFYLYGNKNKGHKGHGDHVWNVLKDGTIVDATHDQFGKPDIAVLKPGDPEYARYHAYCGSYECPICTCHLCNEGFAEEAKNKTSAHKPTILYLDDVRVPTDPSVILVRNYDEFVEYLKTHPMPDIVSLDHDLHEEHLPTYAEARERDDSGFIDYSKYKENTGLQAAEYIVDNNLPLKGWQVHSANPVGGGNIWKILHKYRPKGEKRISIPHKNTEQEVYQGRVQNGFRVGVSMPPEVKARAKQVLADEDPTPTNVAGWSIQFTSLNYSKSRGAQVDSYDLLERYWDAQEKGKGFVLESHDGFVWVQRPKGKKASYAAYVLTPAARDLVLEKFPPKFPDVIAHHVTYQFGSNEAPPPASIVVVGYTSDDSLECLVVSVDGSTERPDGSTYHITLSLDRSQGRKPVDSNAVIEKNGWTPIEQPFDVQVKAKKVGSAKKAAIPAAPHGTKSLEFMRWFGKSVVTDGWGNPLRLYHGTNADFKEFSEEFLGKTTKASTTSLGFFFTNKEGVSQNFGKIIMPVYLKMEKPFDPALMTVSHSTNIYTDRYGNPVNGAKPFTRYDRGEDPFHKMKEAIWIFLTKNTKFESLSINSVKDMTAEHFAEARKRLVSLGFDGIIVRNTQMDGSGTYGREHDFYIVFSNTQIKSAIGNNGEWNGDKADITASKTAAPRQVYYHGTAFENLRSVLSQGLIPNPKKMNWDKDESAGMLSPSRESYGGIYLTRNLLTAMCAPRKRDGKVVLVIVEGQPNAMYLDEDSITGSIQNPLVGMNANEYMIGIYYLSYALPDAPESMKQEVQNMIQKYSDAVVDRMNYKLKERELPPMHPDLEKRLRELLPGMWAAAITRMAAHAFKSDPKRIQEAGYDTRNYDYRRYYSNVMGDVKDWDSIPAKDTVIPPPEEAEKNFREQAEKITRTLRSMLRASADFTFNSCRTTEPIGYSGSNRIVAVLEIRNGRQYQIEYNDPEGWNGRSRMTPIVTHYGQAPEDFLEQWRQREGTKICWLKPGEEPPPSDPMPEKKEEAVTASVEKKDSPLSFRQWIKDVPIYPLSNAADLRPMGWVGIEDSPEEPFMGSYTLRKLTDNGRGYYTIFDGAKPIAAMAEGHISVTPKYRKQGIALEMVKKYMQEFPNYKPKSLNRKSYKLFQKAFEELYPHGRGTKTAASLPTYEQWLKHIGGIKGVSNNWDADYDEIGERVDADFRDKKGFEQWLRDARYPYVIRELKQLQFPLTIYRALYVANPKDLRLEDVGIYWTTDAENAEAYWAEEDANTYLEAKVSSDQIDWLDTLTARMHFITGDDENEITLKKGTKLSHVRVNNKPVSQPVMASTGKSDVQIAQAALDSFQFDKPIHIIPEQVVRTSELESSGKEFLPDVFQWRKKDGFLVKNFYGTFDNSNDAFLILAYAEIENGRLLQFDVVDDETYASLGKGVENE